METENCIAWDCAELGRLKVNCAVDEYPLYVGPRATFVVPMFVL